MKKLIAANAIFLGWSCAAWAAAPAPLPTLHAIHALTNAEATKALPVAFEATVTYFRGYEKTLFVQDGDEAIFVLATTDARLAPGDRILVRGTTRDSFRPIVSSKDITFLHHGAVPKPIPASYNELIRAQHDCMLVSVRATVRAADLVNSSNVRSTYMQMVTDGGGIDADVDGVNPDALKDLLDAQLEVSGVAAGRFDGKMQQTGILLHVSSFADVKVLKRADADPLSLPVTGMDEILNGYHVQVLSQRIRVHGTVTYYQPGSAVVLQSGSKSLWIQTRANSPLQIGEVVDATGFPGLHDGFLTLTNGAIQSSNMQAPIAPQPATWQNLALSKHVFDLVSIEGRVVTEVRETAQDEYVLVSDGQMFSAILRRPPSPGQTSLPPPPMRQIPMGSRIRVTGICRLDDSNPFNAEVPFAILMRSPDDISVVAKPSLLTIRNLMMLVAALIAVVLAIGARGLFVERKVRRENAALAYIERRRSRILEDINGTRPLAEIIEQITELVSFKLRGAPCWCQISDGAQLGNCPAKLDALRICNKEIPGHAGAVLGIVFTAFDPLAETTVNESEGLTMAIGLAALAIETRRLYSDLVRRSEFDQLTDIHNRFSMERYLNEQIVEARQNATVFGLIYVDLDQFKRVNDVYGHHVGDVYLQEAALRMKHQLRKFDMVARLGGDEFAVLLPRVRSREKVEEIALRLEHCFDEPFAIEGYILHGAASIGIALYPEDATTADSLLNSADAAMYVSKHSKPSSRTMPEEQQKFDPTPESKG